jgi:hypothetical protein
MLKKVDITFLLFVVITAIVVWVASVAVPVLMHTIWR